MQQELNLKLRELLLNVETFMIDPNSNEPNGSLKKLNDSDFDFANFEFLEDMTTNSLTLLDSEFHHTDSMANCLLWVPCDKNISDEFMILHMPHIKKTVLIDGESLFYCWVMSEYFLIHLLGFNHMESVKMIELKTGELKEAKPCRITS